MSVLIRKGKPLKLPKYKIHIISNRREVCRRYLNTIFLIFRLLPTGFHIILFTKKMVNLYGCAESLSFYNRFLNRGIKYHGNKCMMSKV